MARHRPAASPSPARRPSAVLAVSACTALAAAGTARGAEPTYVGPANGIWTIATNWSTGTVPAAGDVADLFAGSRLTYNVTAAPPLDLAAVQVAGGTTAAPATLVIASAATGPFLQAGGLFVGGTVTGTNGGAVGTGAGVVLQQAGTVTLDPPTTAGAAPLAVDPAGTYALSGGRLSTDAVANAGAFNLSGGSLGGTTVPSFTAFANTGVLTVTSAATAGSLAGTLTNGAAGTVAVNGAAAAIVGTVVDNGSLTFNGSAGTFAATLTGSGSASVLGGSVTLAGSGAGFTGQAAVRAGTLTLAAATGAAVAGPVVVSSGATLVDGLDEQVADGSTVTVNGGTFNLNGHAETIGALAFSGGQVAQTAAGAPLAVASGAVTVTRGSATVAGGLRSPVGFAVNVSTGATLSVGGPFAPAVAGAPVPRLTLTGGGTLALAGTSPLTVLDVEAGTAQLSVGGLLGSVNQQAIVAANGVLNLNGQSLSVGDLSGAGRVTLGTGALTVASTTAGSSFAGGIAGTGSLTEAGPGTLTLTGANPYTGSTTVSAGTLTVAATGSLATSAVMVAPGATLNVAGRLTAAPTLAATGTINLGPNTSAGASTVAVASINLGATYTNAGTAAGRVAVVGPANPAAAGVGRTLVVTGGVTFAAPPTAAGAAASPYAGQLDLGGNDMVVRGGNLPAINAAIAAGFAAASGSLFAGPGITSSSAATDPRHLTAVGAILNQDVNGNPLYGTGTTTGSFDGTSPAATDVLLRYTYFGDANLDGVVTGADYARIDAAFPLHLTGWANGDFNYDGVVDGADYTLIDNAFNQQLGNVVTGVGYPTGSSARATPTAELAAVPEPAGVTLLGIGCVVVLRWRQR